MNEKKEEYVMITIEAGQCVGTMEVYPCEGTAKGVIVICPGGGYSFLSPREAGPVARAYNANGYYVFVFYYEIEREILGDIPLQQLGKAVRYVKEHRAEYGLEDQKIFVCGFSAGGHLAASLGILWNQAEFFTPGTDLEAQKPDGMILCYPVITATEKAHRGSFERLAGPDPEAQMRYSLENWVNADTVPAFLWGTANDETVPVENSLLLLEKMSVYRIPMEYHLYPFGTHGLSLATEEVQEIGKERLPNVHVARWLQESVYWLEEICGAR